MATAPAIYVIANQSTARLRYIVDLLFGQLLDQTAKVVPLHQLDQVPADGVVINYTQEFLPRAILHIPPEGLLYEKEIRSSSPPLSWADGMPRLFPMEQLESLGFDILSAAFYHASGYAYYQSSAFDDHQRHDEASLFPFQHNLQAYPYVHHYAGHLAENINPHMDETMTLPSPDWHLTWDIDNPWAYRHRGLWNQLKGIGGDMKNRGIKSLFHRLQTLSGFRMDPYYTFHLMRKYSPASKTTFFCLINGSTKWDSPYKASNPAYQGFICDLRDAGYEVGLHPSYNAGFKPALLKQEKQALEAVLGQPVTHSRQHFLRYRIPDTFRHYQEQGILQDFSLTPIRQGGFVTGMARPYPWFDLYQNEPQDLMLHPTMVMDRTLQLYQALSPAEGLRELRDYQERCYQAGGIFTILLHNETLSEEGDWAGWQAPLLEWLAEQDHA